MQECALFTGYQPTPAAGASSFGMSGVNAHGLFTASAQPAAPPANGQLPWRAVRTWMAPQNVAMLQRHMPDGKADICRHDHPAHPTIQMYHSQNCVSWLAELSCTS